MNQKYVQVDNVSVHSETAHCHVGVSLCITAVY